MLIISTVGIALAMATISLVYQYAFAQFSGGNRIGYAIIVAGWAVKTFTLSAMVIRACVAIQAAVCTSLAAALLLEGNGVPLPDVLHFAALRSV